MKLIVGLGNPGRTYAHNRHNIGYHCVNYFARLHSIKFEQRECRARIGIGELAGNNLLLAKPRTFVNLSGKAVGCLVKKHDVLLSDLLVIYDDLALPLGEIRIRPGGSSGGHNGMKSIISTLGSEDFPRLRVGIGHPEDKSIVVNYVLGDFTLEEQKVIRPAIVKVAEAMECFLSQGIEIAMNKFN